MEDRDRPQRKKQKIKMSKYAYKSCKVPMIEVFEAVSDLLRKAGEYRTYCRPMQSRRYDDDMSHELHRMAEKTAAQMKNKSSREEIPCQSSPSRRTLGQPATDAE